MWMVRPHHAGCDLEAILTDPDAVLAERAEIIKTSGSSTLGRFGGYVIKRWMSHGMTARFKDCVRGPRAQRAGLRALELARAGIPTPAPMAWGWVSSWDDRRSSFLVMEDLIGAVDLGRWQGDRASIGRRLGCLIGCLHQQGFTHRDLKPSNVLIMPDGRPFLIDLDGLRKVGSVSHADAVSDVIKLARRMVELSSLSLKEAASFVAGYAAAGGGLSRRDWWRSLAAAATHYDDLRSGPAPVGKAWTGFTPESEGDRGKV
jgi:tRNA A-37 threonylcarbamoyl transferase component Bud32